jgi:hypothetical protein
MMAKPTRILAWLTVVNRRSAGPKAQPPDDPRADRDNPLNLSPADVLHRLAEQFRQTPVSATAIVMILAIGLNPVTHTNTSAQINWSNPRSRRVQNRNTRAGTTAPLH